MFVKKEIGAELALLVFGDITELSCFSRAMLIKLKFLLTAVEYDEQLPSRTR